MRGSIAGRVLQQAPQLVDGIANIAAEHDSYRQSINSTFKADTEPEDQKPEDERFFTEEEQEAIRGKAVCRGKKLLYAMILDENQARSMLQWPHVQSDWDGDMKEELKAWGYIEDDGDSSLDAQCDFSEYHNITAASTDFKIDTRSAGMGRPNRCYYVAHRDGPAIFRRPDGSLSDIVDQYYEADGKKYRVNCITVI